MHSHIYMIGLNFSAYNARRSRSNGVRAKMKYERHSPQTRLCDYQFETKFFFSLHDTRMKFRTRSRVSFGMKTGMNSFQNDLYGKELSFRYFVNKYREKKEME